jgi:iron complex outermembrane receptor protein
MHGSVMSLRRLAILVLALTPVATLAQEPPPITLEEIVVTATKRATPLQDVPFAVSALTSEDLLARGYTQYADYLSSLPGVYFSDAGPGVSQIRIRGVRWRPACRPWSPVTSARR